MRFLDRFKKKNVQSRRCGVIEPNQSLNKLKTIISNDDYIRLEKFQNECEDVLRKGAW
jgi:hypothetical protein